jgi:hypothetical protein
LVADNELEIRMQALGLLTVVLRATHTQPDHHHALLPAMRTCLLRLCTPAGPLQLRDAAVSLVRMPEGDEELDQSILQLCAELSQDAAQHVRLLCSAAYAALCVDSGCGKQPINACQHVSAIQGPNMSARQALADIGHELGVGHMLTCTCRQYMLKCAAARQIVIDVALVASLQPNVALEVPSTAPAALERRYFIARLHIRPGDGSLWHPCQVVEGLPGMCRLRGQALMFRPPGFSSAGICAPATPGRGMCAVPASIGCAAAVRQLVDTAPEEWPPCCDEAETPPGSPTAVDMLDLPAPWVGNCHEMRFSVSCEQDVIAIFAI